VGATRVAVGGTFVAVGGTGVGAAGTAVGTNGACVGSPVFAGTSVASSLVSDEVVLLVVLLVEVEGLEVLVVDRVVVARLAVVEVVLLVLLEVTTAVWSSLDSPPEPNTRTATSATTITRGMNRINGLFRGLSPRT
jgi:hypothetical protein